MVLKTVGVAGTLESSDAMITVEPANQGGIVIDISSSVKRQFGRQIEETVLNTIKELGVENANVKVVDKGALNSVSYTHLVYYGNMNRYYQKVKILNFL